MTEFTATPFTGQEKLSSAETAMADATEALADNAVASALAGALAIDRACEGYDLVETFDTFYDHLQFMAVCEVTPEGIDEILPGHNNVAEFCYELTRVQDSLSSAEVVK